MLVSVVVGLALPVDAVLQFSNVLNLNVGSKTLYAAAYDGNSTFLAVGDNSAALLGTFSGGQMQWSNAATLLPSVSLRAATYGSGFFLAGATNSHVYETANGNLWEDAGNPFSPSTPYVMGLAFNPGSSEFIAVGSAKVIGYAIASTNWNPASLPGGSFLESYRGVTAGTNGFAACGIGGNIRTSSDGVTWIVSYPFNPSDPDLYGIAAGNGSSFVAVGKGGWVLPTTSGIWTEPSANNLNAVAFSSVTNSPGFIAVGDLGTILTSPDGSTWTRQTSPTGNNLQGVAFANSGSLQGVGMLVGVNGTVVLAGTPPLAPVTNAVSSQTNCSFNLSNPALTVTVVPDGAHPAGTVGIDWYDATGIVKTNNSTSYQPTNTIVPPSASTNYIYYAVARDLRTGFTNTVPTPVTLTLNPQPLLTISLAKTNVILEWFGNSQLQSAPGLTNTPPFNWWSTITTGVPCVFNQWTNPVTGLERFFRLYAP
jgi:hypothetical protein